MAGGRLPRITGADLVRALRRDGWYLDDHGGRHDLYRHPTKPGVVPRHPSQEVKLGTLAGILRQAGLTRDEFRRLL
ncbi:MAG: type II toxin-antitoxin system HicA family toxin [Dehalococcoidia bacterium]